MQVIKSMFSAKLVYARNPLNQYFILINDHTFAKSEYAKNSSKYLYIVLRPGFDTKYSFYHCIYKKGRDEFKHKRNSKFG